MCAGKVLVVEDDPDIAALIRLHLEGAHCQVSVATDGKQGLKAALSEPVDLVVPPLKIAALWVDSGEKVANQALEFQAKATEWSKNTMFAPIFEMQNSIARNYVELSAKTARRLWQLE